MPTLKLHPDKIARLKPQVDPRYRRRSAARGGKRRVPGTQQAGDKVSLVNRLAMTNDTPLYRRYFNEEISRG